MPRPKRKPRKERTLPEDLVRTEYLTGDDLEKHKAKLRAQFEEEQRE